LATPQSRNKRYERTKSSKGEKIQFNAAHALLELQVAEIDNEETLFDVEKSDQSHWTLNYQTLSIHAFFLLLYQDRISGVMIIMFASSAVDHGFEP
jgi:hypothetical protein